MACNIIKTICPGCMRRVTANIEQMTATMQIPSNGRRGAARRAGYTVSTTLYDIGDALVGWDCPGCGQAHSGYATADDRRSRA